MGNHSSTKQIYSDEEMMWLKFNYEYHFLKSKNEEVRSISMELLERCKSITGIIKAYYPYQTREGRPITKRRDKGCRYQYWKVIRMTEAGSLRVLKQCLLNYHDVVNGEASLIIEIHKENDIVEC